MSATATQARNRSSSRAARRAKPAAPSAKPAIAISCTNSIAEKWETWTLAGFGGAPDCVVLERHQRGGQGDRQRGGRAEAGAARGRAAAAAPRRERSRPRRSGTRRWRRSRTTPSAGAPPGARSRPGRRREQVRRGEPHEPEREHELVRAARPAGAAVHEQRHQQRDQHRSRLERHAERRRAIGEMNRGHRDDHRSDRSAGAGRQPTSVLGRSTLDPPIFSPETSETEGCERVKTFSPLMSKGWRCQRGLAERVSTRRAGCRGRTAVASSLPSAAQYASSSIRKCASRTGSSAARSRARIAATCREWTSTMCVSQ